MKYKDWLVIMVLVIIITGPYFMGFYGFGAMVLVAMAAVMGGMGGEWMVRPRKMTLLFSSDFYLAGIAGNAVTLRTPDHREIVRKMIFKMAFKDAHGRVRRMVPIPEKVVFDEVTNEMKVKYSSEWYEVELCFRLKKDSPLIHGALAMSFYPSPDHMLRHDDGRVYLEYASVDCSFPWHLQVKALFLKNRTRSKWGGVFPIWLDKQGLSLGSGQRTFHLYHAPGISSLRYRRWPHKLSIFADHAHDHRFVTVSEKGGNLVYWDRSSTTIADVYHHACQFSFQSGHTPVFQPVFWMHALGHDATLIWTGHPDNSQWEATMAVNLGDSRLMPDDLPVGGFAFHKIPVTHGVFYTTDNPQNISLFNHPESEKYRELIQRLNARDGYEITLHTASSHPAEPECTGEALQYLHEHYDNVNWIDHSAHVKREALSGQGAESGSTAYILDLLKKHGVRYAWHYGSELKYSKGYNLHDDALGLNLMKKSKGWGAGEHTPLFWRHPSRLGDMITWKSMVLGRLRHFPINGFQWLLWFLQKLPALVRNHGVCIVHDYPCWFNEKKHAGGNGIYLRETVDGRDHFLIDPAFDQLLKHLGELNHNGKLHCTTVRQFLDYQCATENLAFDYHDPKSIILRNKAKTVQEAVLAFSDRFRPEGPEWTWIRDTRNASLYHLKLEGEAVVRIDFSLNTPFEAS